MAAVGVFDQLRLLNRQLVLPVSMMPSRLALGGGAGGLVVISATLWTALWGPPRTGKSRLPDAWRWGGAPKGNSNAREHGLYTAEAVRTGKVDTL